MLYQAIVAELWCKDLSAFVNPPCGREQASLLSDRYLFDQVHQKSDCLSKIVIQLFDQRALGMDREDIYQIVKADEQRGKHKWFAPNVTRTSFLDLNGFSEHKHLVYSFVQQTLQEYFAAQWLIQNSLSLPSYIRKYKYDSRFTIVFRFVAGLLYDRD